MANLIGIVKQIVNESKSLKDRYTSNENAPVEFACIFCQSDDEYEAYSNEIIKLGKPVQDTPTGFTYLLYQPLQTVAGPLRLVKIRKPDPFRKELGDADFNTDYQLLKNKYLNNLKFELVKRDEFEMLRLSEPSGNVMACFSNIPLKEILNLDYELSNKTNEITNIK